jgi:hypothetical protein
VINGGTEFLVPRHIAPWPDLYCAEPLDSLLTPRESSTHFILDNNFLPKRCRSLRHHLSSFTAGVCSRRVGECA